MERLSDYQGIFETMGEGENPYPNSFVITYEKRMINLRLIWCYVTFSLYSLTWIPITVIGWLKKDNKEWSHTKHTRSITLDELEKTEKIQNV